MIKLRSFLLLFLMFSSILNASEKTFKVSYDPDYAPFSYVENDIPQGLLVDYWKLWAEKNNYTIDFVNGKFWEGAIELAKTKKVDFFLGTKKYENWMKASNSFYKTQTSLFALKENSKNFNKNAYYIIGIVGNDYEETIKNNFPNSQIIIYQDYTNIIKDFTSNKIDLLYDDKLAIEYYTLQNRLFHKVRSLSLLVELTNIQAISNDKKSIDIFNDGLKNLTKEELYDIENKWIINEKDQYYTLEKKIHLTNDERKFIKNNIIKVSVSKSWKPFTFQSSENEPVGISSEIWQVLSEKIGLEIKYHFEDDFTEQLNSIKNKKNDLIFSVGKTKQREKYSIFSEPYIDFPILIVTLKDENYIEDMHYLFDKKIAVGKNFTSYNILREKYPNLNFLFVKDIEEGLEKVSNGQAFAFIDIKPNLIYNIKKLEYDNLKISGNTGLNFPLRIMIRDDYPLLQSILDKAISTLDKKELDLIVDRWNNIHFENNFDYTKIWIILAVIIAIFIILLYVNQINLKKNITLKETVEERTKELKELNAELEQRVNKKTKELKRANYLLDEAQKIAHLGSFHYLIKKDELFWSEEHYKIFGLYPKEIVPSIKKFLSYIHEDDRKSIRKQFKKIRFINNPNKITFEYRIITADKTIKYIQATAKITKFDINNRPLLMIGTILDLTRVKQLEKEKRDKDTILAQQSKMAAMGEMLENIAHQWRQPLSVISTASTGLQLQIELQKEIPLDFLNENVISINEQAQYLSRTIDDFRNFFHQNKEKANFYIKDSIEKALYLTSSRIKKHDIQIIENIEETRILTLENELIQVLLNIFNNAIDILIEKNYSKYIFIKTETSKKELRIYIKDNAEGISKDIIHRIFEPYFTTKHKSQGTGIGLYMSNEIVSKHLSGELKVHNIIYSHEGSDYKGAQFTITIPLNASTL